MKVGLKNIDGCLYGDEFTGSGFRWMGIENTNVFFGCILSVGVAIRIALALELLQFSPADNNNNSQAQDVKEWCNAVLKSDF